MGPIPTLAELQQFNVNRPDQVEVVAASLYDFQTYAQAGQTSLQFFQIPKGQSSKTFADTNMTLAGSLPAPISFLVQTIEIYFFPGNTVGSTAAAAAAPANWNDTWLVGKSGWLELFIGSKPYLDEAPLMKFPPRSGLGGVSGIAGTYAAGTFMMVDYASFAGPCYELASPILLVPTQNFSVTLNWASAQAVAVAGRIGVNLGGLMYRNSQ